MKIKTIVKYVLSIPKIIYLNYRVFPIEIAWRLPVFCHYHTKLESIFKGCFKIETDKITPGMIKLGCGMGSKGVFNGAYPSESGGGYLDIHSGSEVIFKGNATFAGGFSLRLDNGGKTIFGNDFACNSYCFIASNKKISFGDECTLGWHVKIRDVDGHDIFYLDDPTKMINTDKEVAIGSHVWIASYVDILKGTCIPDDVVVAYGSKLTGQKFTERNCIIGGNPVRILKTNINWKI
ncbi:hypothetical protein [Butyrivibrio fibrisolvens]|uniref:hypothetical protein n=1 Tax=Butyrivibrio fibrisolvens TaxID=831 RepID=UPI000427E284|nr:hypothetical protein [Butyrivibrio fibrisolvens]